MIAKSSDGLTWQTDNRIIIDQASVLYGLRGCRSIRPSPFPEETGRVWYFSGFDQTDAVGRGATGPRAWIYRAELPKTKP